MMEWGELVDGLISGGIEYVEIWNNVVYRYNPDSDDFDAEYQNLRGAVERDGNGWIVRMQKGVSARQLETVNKNIEDIYIVMAHVFAMSDSGDMRLVQVLPLSQKREWVTVQIGA